MFRSLVSCVILMYLPCFMLVYSIYCIEVSSLLYSPSVDKPCTGNMSSDPPPQLVYKLSAGGKVM